MFQVIPSSDDKVMLRTSRKCCKNDYQGEVTQRTERGRVMILFTALRIVSTNTHAKIQVSQTLDDKVML